VKEVGNGMSSRKRSGQWWEDNQWEKGDPSGSERSLTKNGC
jgi:hypothetical protein